MSAWTIENNVANWDVVCDRAWAGEPQFITRGGSQTVVVISLVEYRPQQVNRRKIVRNPNLAFKISDADLFVDDSSMWEANDE